MAHLCDKVSFVAMLLNVVANRSRVVDSFRFRRFRTRPAEVAEELLLLAFGFGFRGGQTALNTQTFDILNEISLCRFHPFVVVAIGDL